MNDNADAKSNSGMAFSIHRTVESLHSLLVKLYSVSRAFGNPDFLRRLAQSSLSIKIAPESFCRANIEDTSRAQRGWCKKEPRSFLFLMDLAAFDVERDVLAVS